MSLADQFEAAAVAVLPIDTWVEQHPERDTIKRYAANPAIPTARFHAILRAEGCKVGKDAVATFRRANGYVAR